MSLCSLIGQHWMDWWFTQATGFVNWCKLLLVLRLVRVVSRCCLISCSELKPKSQQEEVAAGCELETCCGKQTRCRDKNFCFKDKKCSYMTTDTWSRFRFFLRGWFKNRKNKTFFRLHLFWCDALVSTRPRSAAYQSSQRHNFLKTNVPDPIAFFQPKF